MVQVKSMVKISPTILDLIFLMQVLLGNKEIFGKWAKSLAFVSIDLQSSNNYQLIVNLTETSAELLSIKMKDQ